MQSGLTVYKHDIALQQVTPYALCANIPIVVLCHQHLRQRFTLTLILVTKIREEALLVLNITSTGIGVTTVHHQFAQHLHVIRGYRLGVTQLLGKAERNSNLVCIDVGIGSNHRTSGKVHTLSHHIHTEQSFLVL